MDVFGLPTLCLAASHLCPDKAVQAEIDGQQHKRWLSCCEQDCQEEYNCSSAYIIELNDIRVSERCKNEKTEGRGEERGGIEWIEAIRTYIGYFGWKRRALSLAGHSSFVSTQAAYYCGLSYALRGNGNSACMSWSVSGVKKDKNVIE